MKFYVIKCVIRNVINSIFYYLRKIFKSGKSILKFILIIYIILIIIRIVMVLMGRFVNG